MRIQDAIAPASGLLNTPVIQMGGYRYYMGHLVNGACGGVIAMMGKASYDKYIS